MSPVTLLALDIGNTSLTLGLFREGELIERSPAGSRVTVIATGGYTNEPWLTDVPGIDRVEPDLTLRGIRHAWERIRAAREAQPASREQPA